MQIIENMSPIMMGILATLLTWFATALGAGIVFLQKTPSRKFFDVALGFAGGIMVSASFFSLLLPAMESAEGHTLPVWFIITSGFLLGSLFIYLLDKIIPHIHPNMPENTREGIGRKVSFHYLLVLAITMHNIPEGLALGVAFGSLQNPMSGMTLSAAISLTIVLSLHNIPEGMAVAIPLRGLGMSRLKAFFYGQLSGSVLPLAGIIGIFSVQSFAPMMPYALAFAAGAMIYVVVEEVIPETQMAGNTDIATLGFLAGFVIMMIFDLVM